MISNSISENEAKTHKQENKKQRTGCCESQGWYGMGKKPNSERSDSWQQSVSSTYSNTPQEEVNCSSMPVYEGDQNQWSINQDEPRSQDTGSRYDKIR